MTNEKEMAEILAEVKILREKRIVGCVSAEDGRAKMYHWLETAANTTDNFQWSQCHLAMERVLNGDDCKAIIADFRASMLAEKARREALTKASR